MAFGAKPAVEPASELSGFLFFNAPLSPGLHLCPLVVSSGVQNWEKDLCCVFAP